MSSTDGRVNDMAGKAAVEEPAESDASKGKVQGIRLRAVLVGLVLALVICSHCRLSRLTAQIMIK